MSEFLSQIIEKILEFGQPIVIIIITLALGLIFNRFYFSLFKRRSIYLKNDPTKYNFLGHLLTALIYIIGFSLAIISVPQLKALATSLLAGASILALGITFASQQALSNIVSGIFIVIFKPFRVNDRLIVRDTLSGIVEDITLRHTVIKNFENRRIIIPNSVISNEVLINSDLNDEKICRFFDMGISYDSDIDLAKKIISEEVRNHPDYFDVRSEEDINNGLPEVSVRVLSMGDSSVNIRAWVWAKNSAISFGMNCDLLESIKKRFDREGVEIPFPHRTIVQKKPLN
ncbi:mechanosensitive ion channel family protein [Flavobacterium sp. CS20]|uniref:mechanosensitive ion channel family protein n=1 Tax=Flavobacterium sp. CS20 TaxID=2775246 RepID=UPI001B3A64DF|nr:mechanosensitive ion channel family protein [Flavobacterium sp. CS20]QTY27327.1 mechanosensitive ion channel family protein [Flavobacterium sp. CS20]